MNLFTNLYNDIDEIREWLKKDSDAANALMEGQSSASLDTLDLNGIAAWLIEHENEASRYREFHYEKLWSDNSTSQPE